MSGRGLPDVHQAWVPVCELAFFCHSSSMRLDLAVQAIDLTSSVSILFLVAWMLSISSNTVTTASLLLSRSSDSTVKKFSNEFFLASSTRSFSIILARCLGGKVSKSSFSSAEGWSCPEGAVRSSVVVLDSDVTVTVTVAVSSGVGSGTM